MLERDAIEDGITGLLGSVEKFQLGIYALQAEAVHSVLTGNITKAVAVETAASGIRGLALKVKAESGAALKQDLFRLVNADLDSQMSLYVRAWRAGIVQTKPIVSKDIKSSVFKHAAATQQYINDTVDRISRYAGSKVADVVEMAIQDKLRGVSLEKVTRAASNLIIEEGLTFRTPSGRNVHDVYAYVRRNVVTAVAVDSGNRQKELFDSIDIDDSKKWVETSSHWGARPEHAEWQGRIFQSWDEFVAATDYGDIEGLGGINCRHTFYPFIPGISERQFHPKPKRENNRRYEARQEQRGMESLVRRLKTEDTVRASMGKTPENQGKIKTLQGRLREHASTQKGAAKQYKAAA